MKYLDTARRWIRNPAQRAFELRSLPLYWKARRILQKLWHFVVTRRLYSSEGGRKIGQSSQVLAWLAWQIAGSVLFALALFILLVFADYEFDRSGVHYFESHFAAIGTAIVQSSNALVTNKNSIQNFLNTVVQLAGLFLTLYFTAIGLIASTAYARVPGDVRTLAINEKVGNIYIRIVAVLGAISILYLIELAFGHNVGLFGFGAIGLLAITSLFSFLVLGRRAFNFFQPTVFIQNLISDLVRWTKLAASPRRTTQTPSLQDYYRRRAETTVGTYRNIVSLATKEEFHRIEADALLSLAQFTVELTVFYANYKSAISTDSLWFERINKHGNWLTVGHTQLDMALRTGRPVDPERVPNFLWLEEALVRILEKVSIALTNRDDRHHWFKFAERLYYRLEQLAYVFAVEEGMLLFRSQWTEIGSLVDECKLQPKPGSGEASEQLSFYLGAIAYVFSDLMAISIGFLKRVEEITEDTIRVIARDLIHDNESIYAARLPRSVLSEAENILASLRAEKFVEGRIFTPEWYVSQLLARSFIEYIKKTCLLLVSEAEQTIKAKLEAYRASDRYLFIAQIISSGIELCDKFHAHFSRIEERVQMLNNLRQVQDVPWIGIDWKEIHERVAQLYRRLMLSASDVLGWLDSLPASRYWPDFFGQMYSFVAREAYVAMERGDNELFAKVFPSLFGAAILANQRLRQELKDQDVDSMLTWSASPLQDIIELSGYAKLFTELDSKPFYNVVEKTWEAYLANVTDANGALKFITALLKYRLGNFRTAARDIERTAWQQSFERRLRERGILGDEWDYRRRRQITHPSKLIRAFTRGGIRLEHASSVFLVDFVMPRLANQGVEFPYTAKHLAENIADESASENAQDERE